MFWLHAIATIVITLVIRRLRKDARQADIVARSWLDRCLALEVENAHLRLIVARYEKGHQVPEAEIDAIMSRMRAVGLIRPPTVGEKVYAPCDSTDRIRGREGHPERHPEDGRGVDQREGPELADGV